MRFSGPFSRLMRGWLRRLRKVRFFYTPLIEVFIDRAALLHNLNTFKKYSGKDVAPVLKSNAYGHGLVPIATSLKDESLPFMCVDSFFEVLILRNEGVAHPILMLGKTVLENILNNTLKNVAFGVVCFEDMENLATLIKRDTVFHIELDTGLHRHGVSEDELKKIITLSRANPHIRIEGIYTHLADADTPNSVHAEKQIAMWNNLVERYKGELPDLKFIHCAATAGAAYGDTILGNVMRLGRGLYGVNVGQQQLDLRPVLEMRTSITSLRDIEAGESVGYNATYTATEKRRIASIPVGYAEGLDRRLSSKGSVLINGRSCPIIGRISMNITTVDVSDMSEVHIGDEVIVISKNPKDSNSIENMAQLCGAIPYEIIVHIPTQLRRTLV